jgi:hypothetical protein
MPCGSVYPAGIGVPCGMRTPDGRRATCGPVYPAGIDAPYGVRIPRGTAATCGPRHTAGVNHPCGDTCPLGGEAHRCSPPDGPRPLIWVPRHLQRAFRSRLIGVGGPSAPPLSHPCNRVKLILITPDHPLITPLTPDCLEAIARLT